MKISDYIMKTLADMDIKHVFVLSGGGCMHLVDSLGREKRIDYVCNLHEQAAAIGAEAYAQYTNKLSACLVTTGPGGTNAVTGVAGAWLESTPVLFLSGQVKRADLAPGTGLRQRGPQEIDIVSIVKPITKYAVTVTDPQSIRYHLEKAIHLAQSGRRGPVWIDLPLDIQATEVAIDELQGYEPEGQTENLTEMKAAVEEFVVRLQKAQRPTLYVGNGVRASGSDKLVLEIAEKLSIPILLSWKAADLIPENHRLNAGRPGAVGQRGANFTQQNSDLILVLGSRLDMGQVAFNPKWFARGAFKIMVDIDRPEIDKLGSIDLPVAGDAGQFLKLLNDRIKNDFTPPNTAAWVKRTAAWKDRYPVVTKERWDTKGTVSQYVLMDVLSDACSEGQLLVPGSSGPCSEVFMQAFRTKAQQRVVNTQGLGAMGFGLPASIGACLASGRKKTICINGDGGFQLNIQELETVRRLKLPIKYFILCNGGYASIMVSQKNFFGSFYVASEPGSGVTLPDIRRIAAAYDIKTFLMEDHQNIREIAAEVLKGDEPAICEVKVSYEDFTAPRAKSVMKDNGRMVTLPMEDLWPFLPRDEFQENMLIPMLPESHGLES